MTVYLQCVDLFNEYGEKDLKLGRVYKAEDNGDYYTFHINDAIHNVSKEPDGKGRSYKCWFRIVSEKHTQNSMWTVTIMEQYYPTILHFETKKEAKEWYNKYLNRMYDRMKKENDYEIYDSIYLSKVQKTTLSHCEPWEDIEWGACKNEFDFNVEENK